MLRQKPDHRHGDAVAQEVVPVRLAIGQPVILGSPISRAASRGDTLRERTASPSTNRRRWNSILAATRPQAVGDQVFTRFPVRDGLAGAPIDAPDNQPTGAFVLVEPVEMRLSLIPMNSAVWSGASHFTFRSSSRTSARIVFRVGGT